MQKFVKIGGALGATIALVAACVTVPETGRRSLNFMGDANLNKMGLQAYQQVLTKESAKLNTNPRLTQIVKEIGHRIAKVSGEKNFKWEFNVIEENQNNAFALPGGKVAVYSGIAKTAQNSHALAAVMGHEVAHATARHGGERMSQGVMTQIGMSAASIGLSNNKHAGLIMGALGVGTQVGLMLPFSRKHESEADKIGMIYMAKAGYDPREATGFWHRMNAASGSKQPGFLSTHPGPTQRAAALAKLAESPQIQQYYAASQKQPKLAL